MTLPLHQYPLPSMKAGPALPGSVLYPQSRGDPAQEDGLELKLNWFPDLEFQDYVDL